MRMATFLVPLLAITLMMAAIRPAAAHKVVAAAYVEGESIEGEVGFTSGEPAPAGTPVEVTGPDGASLGQVVTDADGVFRFSATRRVDHTFIARLGAGHVATATVSADELPESLPGDATTPAPTPEPDTTLVPASAAREEGGSNDLRMEIRKAVASQIKPLRQELATVRDELRIRDVLGGLGYILGLTGMAFFVSGRKAARS